MSKYLETAKEANNCAVALFELVDNMAKPEDGCPQSFFDYHNMEMKKVTESIARLVNYGLRCSPRPVQSTVRLRAVQEAVRGLPVRVTMEQREDENTGKTYNVLVTKPMGDR